MKLNWNQLPRPIVALSPMADMTDSAFCRTVRAVERCLVRPLREEARGGRMARHTAEGGGIRPSGRRDRPQEPVDAGSDGGDGKASLIVFREMVSAEAVVRGSEKTLNMTDIHPDERPLVQQLFGSDPDIMAEAAATIEAEHNPEGFDTNMGCPVYKIVHNFNGAALMKEPAIAADIVRKMKARISVPLSVKIRLGWSDPRECIEFAKILEDAGADLLTVHGRTKCQGYSGKSDWNMIGQVKRAVSIPVLCNGDVHRAELVPEALRVSGCDGVLIARGALGNPWIFKQIEDPPLLFKEGLGVVTDVPLDERLRVIRLHAKLHIEQYGERSLVSFRKHLIWYFKGLPDAKTLRENVHAISSYADLLSVLTQISRQQSRLTQGGKSASDSLSQSFVQATQGAV